MSFLIYNWSEVSVSLNQGVISAAIDTPSSDTVTQQGSMNIFSYFTPNDTLSQVRASNYFNQVAPNSVMYSVQPYDLIFVTATDGNMILQVTSVTLPSAGNSGTITTAPYTPSSTQSLTVALTAAQIQGMYATPVLLVPAQGAGSLILIKNITWDIAFGTTQYTTGGAIQAQYGNTVHGAGPAASSSIAAATLNGVAASSFLTEGPVNIDVARTAALNTAVYLSNATAAFAAGDSTATLYVDYNVIFPA